MRTTSVLMDAHSRPFTFALVADIETSGAGEAVFLGSGFLDPGFVGSEDLGAGLLLSVTIDPLLLNQWLNLA